MDTARSDQKRMVKEATEKLQMEYKSELQSIRSRFKLMTASSTMESSPSDSTDKIEVSSRNFILFFLPLVLFFFLFFFLFRDQTSSSWPATC